MGILRFLAKLIMPRLVRIGRTISQVGKTIEQAGLAYEPKVMTGDIKREHETWTKEPQIRKLGGRQRPPPGAMVETDDMPNYRYRIIGETKYRNKDTGITWTENSSFYDDELRNKNDYEKRAKKLLKETATGENNLVVGFEVRSIWHNSKFDY